MKCKNCGKYVDNSAVLSGKKSTCPKCGNQFDVQQIPKRESLSGLKNLHRFLFVAGVVLLVTGIILTMRLDESGQSTASGLIGLAIIIAIIDVIVWNKYKKQVAGDLAPRENISGLATVRHDIVSSDRFAFHKGEQVQIESISPDPNRPEYKYVVLSKTLNKRFRLSDNDVSV